ncbi:beta-1 adrenergic receptor-like [Protopterus annectens]|uniref:beta-1 adrenergic receptor-like n=1 Tax=Protopterus annectens TaxID=7888 RepID=UPI001CFAF667|nr:beta-1 adrenergic receptor-like [Protopterus annectens]
MFEGSNQTLCSVCCCTTFHRILTIVFMILLVVAILFGNSVALVVFLGTKHFRTPQGYLKTSLAVADLAVGLFVVPFSVYVEISLLLNDFSTENRTRAEYVSWGFSCYVIGPIFAGCTLVSITTISLLTVERSIAVLKPLHKEVVITKGRTVFLIIMSWLTSFFLAMSPMIFSGDIILEYNLCSRMCNYALLAGSPPNAWNILILFPAFDFTLLGGTVVINILSLTTIRQHSNRRKLLAVVDTQGKITRPSFSDIKAAKTIGTLTLAFTVSFTPVAVLVVGNVLGYQWCDFSFFSFWILTTNSCWNVIIYSIKDMKFRQRAHHFLISPKVPKPVISSKANTQ